MPIFRMHTPLKGDPGDFKPKSLIPFKEVRVFLIAQLTKRFSIRVVCPSSLSVLVEGVSGLLGVPYMAIRMQSQLDICTDFNMRALNWKQTQRG